MKDFWRSPDGSGYSSETEPSSTVSALRVSIPNAARLSRAIELAARAHEGQTDKTGEPYILHPLRVMLRLDCPETRIAADETENTDSVAEP
jgi:(p)ppGpp synthase/HD superfamily hydrolase